MKQQVGLFKNKLLPAAIFLLIAFMLPGCFPQPQQIQKTIAIPEIQYVDATLIEGKTTKQEILNIFGMPESIDATELSYSYGNYNNKYLQARLRIIQKDGTEFNVILGDGLKYSKVNIYFNGQHDNHGRHIPSNINTNITVN